MQNYALMNEYPVNLADVTDDFVKSARSKTWQEVRNALIDIGIDYPCIVPGHHFSCCKGLASHPYIFNAKLGRGLAEFRLVVPNTGRGALSTNWIEQYAIPAPGEVIIDLPFKRIR